jgi:hypothetical protein
MTQAGLDAAGGGSWYVAARAARGYRVGATLVSFGH